MGITKSRESAFGLVEYILYYSAVVIIGQDLLSSLNISPMQVISSYGNDVDLEIQNEATQAVLHVLFLVFIIVVYARNYTVMHNIDQPPYKREHSIKFVNGTTGYFDFFERLFRFSIILIAIVSAKDRFGPLTTTVSALSKSIASSDKPTEVESIFSFYAYVLFFLFILFIVYDLIIVCAAFKRNLGSWKTLKENTSKNELQDALNNDDELCSVFCYLNYATRSEGEHKLRSGIPFISDPQFSWLENQQSCKAYFLSPKFFERLMGISVCFFGVLIITSNGNLFFLIAAALVLASYFVFLFFNDNVLKELGKAICLLPLLNYLLYRRLNSDRETEYSQSVIIRNTKRKINSLIESLIMNKKTLLGIAALLILAFFVYKQRNGEAPLPAKGTLIVWQSESDPTANKVLTELEKEFETVHPHIDLQIETVGWGALSEKLATAQRTGTYPDISHVQPFMAYSLVSKDLLSPISDLVKELGGKHGGILPAVEDLQLFDGEHYGLAYAVGTTFWLTRSDWLTEDQDLDAIASWSDYLELVRKAKVNDRGFSVTLPGGSPFFIHQLYGELLANAGGRFFDPATLKPELDSKENIAVLDFFRNLKQTGALDPAWSETKYTEQFSKMGEGILLSTPVTYARAAKSIDQKLQASNKSLDTETFTWLSQPVPKMNDSSKSVATIDAEPFVVFKSAKEKQYENGSDNQELAIDFLRMFYSERYYKQFTNAVPVQLTPIFRDMAVGEEYLNSVGKLKDWHNFTISSLSDASRTRPIMMPDRSELAKKIPFLLEFEAQKILSRAVARAINEPNSKLFEIASDAQKETEDWLKTTSP